MSRRMEIQVGITVLAALAILVLGVTWLKEFSLARGVRVWRVTFPQTGGLAASDEVQVNGIRSGSVKSMRLEGDQVMVELAVDDDIALTTASRVAIRNVGLMGEKVIAIDYRQSGSQYTERDTIVGVYEKGVPEVMAELGESVTAINSITDQLQAIAELVSNNSDLAGTIRNFKDTSSELRLAVQENRASLRQTLSDFSAAARTTKSLTTDREAQLKRTLDQFSQAAENMNRLSVRIDSLRASLQNVAGKIDRGDGTLGKLVNDDKLYRDVNASLTSLKALIDDIKANPKKYLKVEIF